MRLLERANELERVAGVLARFGGEGTLEHVCVATAGQLCWAQAKQLKMRWFGEVLH